MERLTFDGNFCDIAQCRELPCPYDNNCTQRKVWEKLKAYEETGIEPEQCENAKNIIELAFSDDMAKVERIRKLLNADKEGRLVVLPCRVGDTVYRLKYVEQTPGRFVVGVVEIEFALIWLEEFGNTVFLTREEAEEALEAMKDG